MPRDFAVIGSRGVEQQQGVAGRRGVHHHEFFARLANDAREGLENRDFLGAGRTQIFFEQRAALGVELRALCRQYLPTIAFGFGVRVDAADREICSASHAAFRRDARRDRRW